MSRITEIEIADRKYPLNFSLKATEEVAKRYGDIANIGDVFTNKPLDEALNEATWLLALLLEQGAAYVKEIEEKDVKVFSQETLKIVLGPSDITDIKDILLGAMTLGMKREVEIEPDPKNAKATQNK